jgi:uncharacterized protein (TIGR03435 family)
MRLAAIGLLLTALATQAQLQVPEAQPIEESRFEVASIKPLPAGSSGGWYNPMPGRFTATMNVAELTQLAYQLPFFRLVGGPDWARSERFDINAAISGPRQSGDLWFMLQHLLNDRFALRVHREQRPMPVYALMLARSDRKLGPQLRPVNRTCSPGAADLADRCSSGEGIGTWSSTGRRLNDRVFLGTLERLSGRPVFDRTGLSGQFDIALEWNPALSRMPEWETRVTLADLELRPVLFTAIREQLGLKLEPVTEPIEVLVIDGVERPTEN